MSREIKKMYCNDCQKEVKCEREDKGVNHILHLILSVLSVGWWLIVWFILSLQHKKGNFNCSVCGSSNLKLIKQDKLKENINFLVIVLITIILAYIIVKKPNIGFDLVKLFN